ncbi:hypothetical protein HFO16_32380 [Rhizobium laguerreae]|uniref:hypothetical protein n=1 Tax=Rhizobium laguerreae TaxID=1076926 RepID=UPI001C90676F|nr:hypothetical protein [Rhizobium laguerreae]MBY3246023.1 hypothetical protein [Rhizobium laguerreae]
MKTSSEGREQQAGNDAFQLEDMRVRSEQFLIVWRAIFDYAQIAIRTIIFANGAGAAAILTFLGDALQEHSAPVNETLLGLAAASFAMGVACGVLTAFIAYLSQYDVIRMAIASEGRVPVGSSPKRITGIVLAFVGLGFFLIGIGVAICGYLMPN